MNIVLEGPDGGGKSTLAAHICSVLKLELYHSSGPCKDAETLNERVNDFLAKDRVVFDRHTCVSEYIYGNVRGKMLVDRVLTRQFYDSKPFFIYCRGMGVDHHEVREGEDPAHIKMVADKYDRICELYDLWATRNAHVTYTIGDDMDQIVRLIKEQLDV